MATASAADISGAQQEIEQQLANLSDCYDKAAQEVHTTQHRVQHPYTHTPPEEVQHPHTHTPPEEAHSRAQHPRRTLTEEVPHTTAPRTERDHPETVSVPPSLLLPPLPLTGSQCADTRRAMPVKTGVALESSDSSRNSQRMEVESVRRNGGSNGLKSVPGPTVPTNGHSSGRNGGGRNAGKVKICNCDQHVQVSSRIYCTTEQNLLKQEFPVLKEINLG